MPEKNHIQNEILKVLKYFDFFSFPLSVSEIHLFVGIKLNEAELAPHLLQLTEKKAIFFIQGYYLLVNDLQRVERKINGRKMATKRMKRAKIISRIIMSFPFVRMVAISGSLSKGYADKSTDIDFFIVTTQNQLWTSRTLLHLLKKFSFLVNMQHSFCMNYFISEKHLTIEEKNYFTAVELTTLIPQKGKENYNQVIKSNSWVEDFLPNFIFQAQNEPPYKPKFIKWLLEKILSSKNLNLALMNFTDKRWRTKWEEKGYSEEEYKLAFKTELTVSKNHPGNYQKKILDHLEKETQNSSK